MTKPIVINDEPMVIDGEPTLPEIIDDEPTEEEKLFAELREMHGAMNGAMAFLGVVLANLQDGPVTPERREKITELVVLAIKRLDRARG
ncbi:hypothetical protein KCT17_003678 [Escherichia coli]|nr:hypothetical protein [Escherichia coli]